MVSPFPLMVASSNLVAPIRSIADPTIASKSLTDVRLFDLMVVRRGGSPRLFTEMSPSSRTSKDFQLSAQHHDVSGSVTLKQPTIRSSTALRRPRDRLLADRFSPPYQRPTKPFFLRLAEVEAIEVHDLVPGRNEVVDELLRRVGASVDLRQRGSWEFEPKIRSTRVPVHFSSPVLRSRPSNTSVSFDTGFHPVFMSSRFTKKSLVSVSGRW